MGATSIGARSSACVQDAPTADGALLAAVARSLLLPLIREAVRLELEESRNGEADPLVDVADALPLSRRAAYALARSGKISGAAKVGKKWMARRSAVAALIERRPRLATSQSRTALVTGTCARSRGRSVE